MAPEIQEKQPVLTVIDGQKGKETPDNNSLSRLVKRVKDLVRAVLSREDRQQRKLQAEIEQINIEELCSLSPEDFFQSPQFFQLLKFYNLSFHSEAPITEERLQNNMVAEFIIGGVLTMFIRLRSSTAQDLQKAESLSRFKNRVLQYLRAKDTQQDEIREEVGTLREDNEPVGVPDIIWRFSKLGISLQADDGIRSDWYVFVKDRRYIVNFSYGLGLHKLTRGQMVLIERALRAHVLNVEEFIHILMEGRPYFDDFMKSIINKLSKT